MKPQNVRFAGCLILLGIAMSQSAGCSQHTTSGFVHEIWVLGGNNNFRVNSPDAKEGPFKDRWEAKQDGVLTVSVGTDLGEVQAAELYLELWGGHPGVANKRFTLNERSEYRLPEVGAADGHCTYSYPAVSLNVEDLREGDNQFAFTCDGADTFWGHFLIRTACLRIHIKDDSGMLVAKHLAGVSAALQVSTDPADPHTRILDVALNEDLRQRIEKVEYWGRYAGYDENGDGRSYDWHGFTKDGEPVANIGTVGSGRPTAVTWSLAMIPREKPIEARARIHFKNGDGTLVYETAAVTVADAEPNSPVELVPASDLPRPFWSRAGEAKQCLLWLDVNPERIQQAELHVVIWDGGGGDVQHPVTLNGQPLAVAGSGKHDVLYRVLPISPNLLKRGDNTFKVLSDTEHHGIEVLLPGPALVVRADDAGQKASGPAPGSANR